MFHVNLRFTVENGSVRADDYEIAAKVDTARNDEGERSVWETLVRQLIKEASPVNYFEALPDPTTISVPSRQTFTADEMTPSPYFDSRNTYWSWFAIRQSLIEARWHLAQARTCKAIEPLKSDLASGNRLLYNVHLDKMNHFDLAVYKLAKVEDLFYRLIFENLGASLVPDVDLTRQNWPAKLTRDSIRKGLRLHSSRIARLPFRARLKHRIRSIWRKDLRNVRLEELSAAEYQELVRIFGAFASPHFVGEFSRYRNKITHRNSPSVDYPEVYIEFEDRVGRPLLNAKGERGVLYDMGAERTVPEYMFLPLYNTTALTMGHYIRLLRDLQAIPRFAR